MAFDNNKLGAIFPTRNGPAQGSSLERNMLGAVGGVGGFRTRLQNNHDGSTTMLRTRGGMPEFTTSKIDAPKTQLKKISNWVSGLVYKGFLKAVEPSPAPVEILAMSSPPSGTFDYDFEMEGGVPYMQGFYPSAAQAIKDSSSRYWQDRLSLAVESSRSQVLAMNYKWSQSSDVFPGNFTGEMRKVVQWLLGTKVRVTYTSSAALTYGIYTSGTGTKWLVRVGSAGMFAMRLPVVDPLRVLESDNLYLGYVPSGKDFPLDIAAAIASGKVIQLLSEAVMTEFYTSGSTWFPGCGWAFSGTGNQAQNTNYSEVTVGANRYMTGSRYKIQIIETGGAPSGATLTMVDTGYLFTLSRNDTHPKFPLVELSSLYSVDMRGQTLVGEVWVYGAPEVVCDTPLYVFYDGDEEKVIRYVRNVSVDENNDDVPLMGHPEGILPVNLSDYGVKIKQGVTGVKRCGFVTEHHNPPTKNSFEGSYVEFSPPVLIGSRNAGGYTPDPVTGRDRLKMENLFGTWKESGETVNTADSATESFIVPFNEREGYFHFVGNNTSNAPLTIIKKSYVIQESVAIAKHVPELEDPSLTYAEYLALFPYYVVDDWLTPPDGQIHAYFVSANTQEPYADYGLIFNSSEPSAIGLSFNTQETITTDTDESILVVSSFYFAGSGGIKSDLLSAYANEYGGNPFFEQAVPGTFDQIMYAARNAFSPYVHIISDDINAFHGADCNNTSDYPVTDLVSAIRNFIGPGG